MKIIVSLVLGIISIGTFSFAHAATPVLSETQRLQESIERISPSVVTIIVGNRIGRTVYRVGTGTGFIFTTNGYVLTNNHVVSDPKRYYIAQLSNGDLKKADVVYKDAVTDVAVLKIEGTYPSIAIFGNSSYIERGQLIASLGSASTTDKRVSAIGNVTDFNMEVVATGKNKLREELSGLLVSTADINPGYSGGPIINSTGHVIGMNVAKNVKIKNLSFMIPIDTIKTSIRDFFSSL
ncbi:MAG: S1C family serine protease [bacterium]|nr:S1C family serine protease [bacterium]